MEEQHSLYIDSYTCACVSIQSAFGTTSSRLSSHLLFAHICANATANSSEVSSPWTWNLRNFFCSCHAYQLDLSKSHASVLQQKAYDELSRGASKENLDKKLHQLSHELKQGLRESKSDVDEELSLLVEKFRVKDQVIFLNLVDFALIRLL
jgi:hypothetical protein